MDISILGIIFWVVVSNICYFHPYLGKIPILTNIFQRGWNHQLVLYVKEWANLICILNQVFHKVNLHEIRHVESWNLARQNTVQQLVI